MAFAFRGVVPRIHIPSRIPPSERCEHLVETVEYTWVANDVFSQRTAPVTRQIGLELVIM